MTTKELSKDLRDKVVERHRSGDGENNILKALNISWSTVKTIIKKWKAYGTIKTLPRSGRPSKLDDQARRKLIREATKRPMATLKELQPFMEKTGHFVHVTISQALHKSDLHGRVARKKPLLKKAYLESRLRCAKKHSEAICQKVLWSDKTEIERFGRNLKRYVWCKPNTSPKEHHPYCEAWWWQHHVMGMFLISMDCSTCQDRRENGWSKIQKNLRGKLAALCKKAEIGTEVHLSAWQRPNAHIQSSLEWLRNKKIKVLERPSQSADLNPIENLWHDLKIAVHQHSPCNLTELKQFCSEECTNISQSRCAKIVETYPNSHTAATAVKDAYTKY